MVAFGFQLAVVAALSSSVAYLVTMLLSLYRRGFSTWLHGFFVLYLTLSILWGIGTALSVWHGLPPHWPQLGWEVAYGVIVILPILLVILTTLFFERPRVELIAGIGGALVLLVALVDNDIFGLQTVLQRNLDMPSAKNLLHTLRWSMWGGFSAGAIVLAAWDYIRTRRPLHRNRILYWLVALLLTVSGEGLTLSLNPESIRLGLVVRMFGVLLMTFALVSYYLPSLREVARRMLSTTFVTLLTGGLYLAALWVVRPLWSALDETSLLIVYATLALMLAVLTPPLRLLFQNILDKVLWGGRYDPGRALREYSAAISNIVDLNLLVTVAIGIISEAMETTRGALMLLTEQEDGGATASIIPGMGEVNITEAQFTPDSPILRHLRDGQPLSQYEIDFLPQFRVTSLPERLWLHNLDMELYVPIHQQGVLIGLITLGARAGDAPYAKQDLNVLSTLADQTTVALQNARLVSDLKTLNTQMRDLNEELTRINRQLEKLDASKTDFIEIASHELRTPITQARGYADMLGDIVQSGMLGPTQALQISQGIGRSTRRLEEIVTAMLDVSQIDVQALSLSKAPISMTTVLRMAAEPYQEGLRDRKQSLTVEGLDGLPPVQGDLQRLCQAFGNIIVNCIKYTPDSGRITVNGRYVAPGEGELETAAVEVMISDTGIGIDPEDQELIFEKFFRVGSPSLHSTGSTKFMGAGPGLGLPIARGIIRAHGGRVWVESKGRDEHSYPGSQFHVLLPAAVALDK